jgi:hypothetical protein
MVWNLQNVRGQREACKANVAAQSAPDDVKAFIASQIDSLPAEVTGCKVDAYCQESKNSGAMTITRNVQITVVGICL